MDTGGTGEARPRRPEADLLAYFGDISSTLAATGDPEQQQQLVDAALGELRNNEASLAADKRGSPVVEALLARASRAQVLRVAAGLQGYMAFLARNRFSSHVLQKVLAMLQSLQAEGDQPAPVPEAEAESESDSDSEPDQDQDDQVQLTPEDAVLAFVDELRGKWVELSCDLCATHVVRAVLCALAGFEDPGKGKRAEWPADARAVYAVPASWAQALAGVAAELGGMAPDQVLELACDPNGGPCLQVLLRVSPPADAESLVRYALVWDDADTCRRYVFELAAERAGSHFLETAVQVCAGLVGPLAERCFAGRLIEYARHPVSNFVVQQLLRRAPADALPALAAELRPHLAALFRDNRAGVVWRLLEACRRVSDSDSDGSLSGMVGDVLAAAGTARGEPAVPALLESPSGGLDVPGARIVGEALRFPEARCHDVLQGVVDLDAERLARLAMDNVGSRCVVEPVLEGGADFKWARRRLTGKLRGRFAELACDHWGGFSVMKTFDGAGTQFRLDLVKELVESERRVMSARAGRRVWEHCEAGAYKEDPSGWVHSLAAKKRRAEMVSSLVGSVGSGGTVGGAGGAEKKRKKKAKKAAAAAGAEAEPEPTERAEKKRKKEKKAKKAAAAGAAAAEAEPEPTEKKPKKPKKEKKTKKEKKAKKEKRQAEEEDDEDEGGMQLFKRRRTG